MLEGAIFSPQLNFVLQRMWIIRRFASLSVPRGIVGNWLTIWTARGYSFDIKLFTEWNYEFDFEVEGIGKFDYVSITISNY